MLVEAHFFMYMGYLITRIPLHVT